MALTDTALFELVDRRFAWTAQRQKLIAQNIANADTPSWRAQDVVPFAPQPNRAGMLWRTSERHMAGPAGDGPASRVVQSERAPDGNSVSVEEQLMHLADTESAHQTTAEIYKKYLALFRTTLGR